MKKGPDTKAAVCVVGGAGYVGSRLVSELKRCGYPVTVVDLCWFGNHLDPSVEVVKKDAHYLEADFYKPFDTVIFLAGLSNDPMAEFSPALNFISNVAVPASVVYNAKKAGVKRFIYADTCSSYGHTQGEESTEDSPTLPHYPYGISKVQGNRVVMALQDDAFSVIALRQGTICGSSPRSRFDLIVNTMYKAAATLREITVHNPATWRPILAMSDAVKGYIHALSAPKNVSGTFNLSSTNITVGEVAEIIRAHFKDQHGIDVAIQTNNAHDMRDYKVTTHKAKTVLGVELTGSIQSILAELDDQYGPAFDFTNDNYYNIVMFKKLLGDGKAPLV